MGNRKKREKKKGETRDEEKKRESKKERKVRVSHGRWGSYYISAPGLMII